MPSALTPPHPYSLEESSDRKTPNTIADLYSDAMGLAGAPTSVLICARGSSHEQSVDTTEVSSALPTPFSILFSGAMLQ